MFCLWISLCSVHVARPFVKGKSPQVLDTTPDFTCGFDIWDQNNRAVAEKNSWQMEGLRNFKVILGIDITPLIQLLYFSCQNESLLFNNFCKKLWGSICFGRSRGCVSV